MARILIIEDEAEMANGLSDNCLYDGHDPIIARDGEEGVALALSQRPELILLDVMLPKKSGFDVCRELRAAGLRTPIIMLTARGQEIDKVLGLELGADDYITKPFSLRELLARIKAVLRRTDQSSVGHVDDVRIGRLQLSFSSATAKDENGNIDLSAKEWDLLRFFVQNEGRVVHRDELLDKVWGYDHFPDTRTIDNFIVRLRKKIEVDPKQPRHLVTVHGMGYRYIK
jgi:DNA-binding response OmpR family regulator